ncbi:MAG: iron transporter [Propionicimonas sp.]|uniref:iron transporter n=1 Tax=Propionicimonas sp. TaxID=1955623 RepID=UPI002B20C31A|nr:iron transporter [Propionicimonas sp.]MEA4943619.1 iron transporter [Propionicimonas sp.]MEA5052749.1 iron transporter [Propionicimonas sp.]
MKIIQQAAIAASALALLLAGCSAAPAESPSVAAGSTASAPAESTEPETTDDPNVVGINELPVGDSGPQQAGDYLEVNAVYFQAIDMEHGTMAMPPASESDMHFEIDIKTTEKAKDIGFEAEQFMPYLKITPKLTEKNTGKVVELGTLMPMIASDGPHYGNNIKLEPGLYTVELSIQSPADDFMLHTGKDTSGVKGRFWTEPLKVTFDNFEWDGQLL